MKTTMKKEEKKEDEKNNNNEKKVMKSRTLFEFFLQPVDIFISLLPLLSCNVYGCACASESTHLTCVWCAMLTLCTRQFIVSTRYTYNACLRAFTLCFNNCHTWQHQTKHVHWKVMACFGVMLPCF